MAFNSRYAEQVRLLLQLLPEIGRYDCFAMKGGTAINLFVRDMPRLSVDIDLTYLPVQDRATSLTAIDQAMKGIAEAIPGRVNEARVTPRVGREGAVTSLLVTTPRAQVKVEVTPVMRGCVYAPTVRQVTPAVEDAFGFADFQIVSFADLYAGKVVAALDRQHPRDLFDVRELLAHEGIDDALRDAFIVYLLSHNRPFHEVLDPTRIDITQEFETNFVGMTDAPVALDELLAAREAIIAEMTGGMLQRHREFLLSFQQGAPDWAKLGLQGVAELPAVQWRQINLAKAPNLNDQNARLEKLLFG
jgi:predicted nucleotidyltransferase component of viral defense system